MKISVCRSENAVKVLDVLTEDQKEEITKLIDDIREAQLFVGKVGESFNAGKECSDCGGICCGGLIEDRIDEIDFFVMLFGQSEEIRKNIILALNRESGYVCSLKSSTGCIVPKDVRPPICKSFFCKDIPDLKRILDSSVRFDLYEKYLLVSKALKDMGFSLGCDHISRYNSRD